jgi:VanZ family protein
VGTRQPLRQSSTSDPAPKVWANRIIGSAILIILLATLSPFEFTAEGVTLKGAIKVFFAHPSDWSDLIGNVLLFMPLGFGIALRAQSQGIKLLTGLAIATIISPLLSFSVELSQVFLPSRSPSWIDISTNTTGGFCGALSYILLTTISARHNSTTTASNQVISVEQKVKRLLTIRNLAVALIAWIMMIGLVSLSLQEAAQLSNWNPKLPLLLGNEKTGDRPWNGTISKVEISDRALSQSEIAQVLQTKGSLPQAGLVTAYDLTNLESRNSLSKPLKDRTGQLPDLVAQGDGISAVPEGVRVSDKHWLSTAEPASVLSNRLRNSSQFTISTIAATSDLDQTGPARILSLSANPARRNFTLGQEHNQLVFRLRTPITGENGVYTALFVPNTFRDLKPHHFLLTYYQSVLRLYVDEPQNSYSLELTPEITLFRYLFPFEGRILQLTNFSISVHKLMFYAVFFAPLGGILALISSRFKQQPRFDILLILGGICVPAFLLEPIIHAEHLRLENIGLSIGIALITMLLSKNKITSWLYSTDKR